MKKLFKWIGIVFVIFIAIGVIASLGEDADNSNTSQPVTSQQTEKAKTEQRPVEPKKPNLEIIDSKVESDQFMRYIVGTVKNNSKKQYSYVQVEINLYDESGNQIGSTLDNINNLEPGATWRFKAIVIEEDAAKYKIKDVTGF
jgi:hypothetical protein